MNDRTVYNAMMKQASLYDVVKNHPAFNPLGTIRNGYAVLSNAIPKAETGMAFSHIFGLPRRVLNNAWYIDEILSGKRKPALSQLDQRVLDSLKALFGKAKAAITPSEPEIAEQPVESKTASMNGAIKLAAAVAGFTMPKGIGNALTPTPAPIKIDNPKKTEGNAQMAQAAAAEGVGVNAGTPYDPVSALTASLDKITAVAKGNLPQAQKPVGDPAVAQSPAEPNPAQIAQQQNQTAPQPGVPKVASFNKSAAFLYNLNQIRKQL